LHSISYPYAVYCTLLPFPGFRTDAALTDRIICSVHPRRARRALPHSSTSVEYCAIISSSGLRLAAGADIPPLF